MTQDAADEVTWDQHEAARLAGRLPEPCGPSCPKPPPAATYVPAVGDRVRIVLEGEVQKLPWGDEVRLRALNLMGKHYDIPVGGSLVVSVEKLLDPEQEFAAGDVVRSGSGRTYMLTEGGWWASTSGFRFSRSLIDNPVTLLVRGGESVAAGGGNG